KRPANTGILPRPGWPRDYRKVWPTGARTVKPGAAVPAAAPDGFYICLVQRGPDGEDQFVIHDGYLGHAAFFSFRPGAFDEGPLQFVVGGLHARVVERDAGHVDGDNLDLQRLIHDVERQVIGARRAVGRGAGDAHDV